MNELPGPYLVEAGYGVQLEWHTEKYSLEIEFMENGKVEFLFENHDEPEVIDGTYAAHSSELIAALRKLREENHG